MDHSIAKESGIAEGQKWTKLLAREDVDVTTISCIDVVFYDP